MIELYINEQLVELPAGTSVSLELFSPVFADVTKIGESFSYSIDIPAIPNNNAIIGFANRCDVSSANDLRARLYVDGCNVADGKAVILSASPDKYQISIHWGGIPALSEAWDKKIADVYTPATPDEAHVFWAISGTTGLTPIGQPLSYGPYATGYGYYRYYAQEGYEGLLRLNRRYMLPMVSTDYLLGLVADGLGITIDTTNLRKCVIPLSTLNGSEYATAQGATTIVKATALFDEALAQYDIPLTFSGNPLDDLDFVDKQFVDPDDIITETQLRASDGALHILPTSLQITFPPGLAIIVSTSIVVNSYDSSDVLLESTTINGTLSGLTASYALQYDSAYDNLAYVKMRLRVTFSDPLSLQGQQIPFSVTSSNMNAYATYWTAPNKLYPILKNLPDLTCGELIQAMCQLSGVYASANGNTLSFIPLYEGVDDSYLRDMSTQYVSTLADPSLVSLNYVNNYAQRNWFRYKEAEEATPSGDGYFDIDNPPLEQEQDLVELPFSPSNTLEGLAHYPLWDSEGKWSGNKSIAILAEETATFNNSLLFKNILASTNYLGWVNVVKEYKEIEFPMQLNAVDINTSQWGIAWVIDALGGVYAPVRISYNSDDLSTVIAIRIV